MARKIDSPTLTIIFRKGLAERRRLPLHHVTRTLQEVDELIREVGKEVQRERGVENPDGDFGIELVAAAGNRVFKAGSLTATTTITRDIENAGIAIGRVFETTRLLERKQPASIDPSGAPVLRRFARISGIQRENKTELAFQFRSRGQRTQAAVFGEVGIATIESISAAGFTVEGLTLYGKLRQLKDRSKEEEGSDVFWGELVADNGEIWRIRFTIADLNRVLPLFRKQVQVTGDATYFKANYPRLAATYIALDPDRDYEAAFDNLHAAYAETFGDAEVEDLLKEIRG